MKTTGFPCFLLEKSVTIKIIFIFCKDFELVYYRETKLSNVSVVYMSYMYSLKFMFYKTRFIVMCNSIINSRTTQAIILSSTVVATSGHQEWQCTVGNRQKKIKNNIHDK